MLGKSKLKYIQSLGQKKQRDIEGVFIAEGPKIVEEWLKEGDPAILQLFALPSWIESTPTNGIEITEISEIELAKISQLQTPNKVLAIVKKQEAPKEIQLPGAVTLALNGIQDPGNMGTILRIADWFGIRNMVCDHDCADIYNPKVVQASMGSVARVRVMVVDDLSTVLSSTTVPLFAAALDGQDVGKMEPLSEGVIVIGNESKGVNETILSLVNQRITIPRIGKAESLNAAVATGIILSHLRG